MDKDKVLLTKSGVEKLEEERDNLINVERPRVIEELQLARSQGDLSENADYDAARDKQAQIEQRIKEIEYMLQNAEIISEEQKLSLKEKLINSKDNPRKIRKICMSEIEEMENEYKKVENEVNKRYNEAFLEKSRKMLKETIENSK